MVGHFINEHTTHAQHVPRVCLALVQRALRTSGVLISGVYIHASSCAHIFVHAQNPDAHNERRRMHSVGPARQTH